VPRADQAPWRAFGGELGPLFQLEDDLLDGDGVVARYGAEEARSLADAAAASVRERLEAIDADTSTLRALVEDLVQRTA